MLTPVVIPPVTNRQGWWVDGVRRPRPKAIVITLSVHVWNALIKSQFKSFESVSLIL